MSGARLQASATERNTEFRDVADALRTVRRLANFMRKQDPAARHLVGMELRNLREVRNG